MNKSIKEMLQELQNNKLTSTAAGSDWCEYYTGLRQNTICIVDTEEKFIRNTSNGLCIIENGKLLENNIRVAYKHMLVQKACLPHII